jgi:hypothetical protein
MAEPAPAVPIVSRPTVTPGTKLLSPTGNYAVEFMDDKTAAISTNSTREVFFKTLDDLLSDKDLGIASMLAIRRNNMPLDHQSKQEALDKMVVQAIEKARQAIREHIRAMSGK